MYVSFVILTWNSASYVEKCISSIINALASVQEFEVLVLDNGSTDGTVHALELLADKHFPRVKLLREDTNIGTTRSRNKLLRLAKGKFICVVDSDVEFSSDVITPLAQVLEREPRIGIVAPRVQFPSGRWQKSFDGFPTPLGKLKRLLFLRKIEELEAIKQMPSAAYQCVDYAISAFWLFKRELLELVGNLDEKIFYAPEDVDYCLRVWKSGRAVVYVPSVHITHHTQEISRGFKLNRAKIRHLQGLLYYFTKHKYFITRPRFLPIDLTAIRERSD